MDVHQCLSDVRAANLGPSTALAAVAMVPTDANSFPTHVACKVAGAGAVLAQGGSMGDLLSEESAGRQAMLRVMQALTREALRRQEGGSMKAGEFGFADPGRERVNIKLLVKPSAERLLNFSP